MKKILLVLSVLLLLITHTSYTKPYNLYQQLCEVNQEWHKYKSIAKQLGYLNMPVIQDEQELLVFHIQALENIFLNRPIHHLSKIQQENRKKHLKVLNEYWKRRDCPHNYYLPYRNPVFIDHQGRYCAVGYLMLKDGKEKFCKAVQKNSNFIFIREITAPEFHAWQQESGLSIDELAWIQPGYDPRTKFVLYNQFTKQGKTITPKNFNENRFYNPEKDTTTFMQTIFFGQGIPYQHHLKKLNYKGKKPNWENLEKKNRILAITVFKNDIYVATDSTIWNYTQINGVDTTLIEERSAILKYNQTNNEWETILDLKGKHRAYKLKNFNGKLLAYGGSHKYNNGRVVYESFLGSYDGKNWDIDKNNYHSIIFMVLGQKGKINYLGTVVNGLDFYNNENGNIDFEKGPIIDY